MLSSCTSLVALLCDVIAFRQHTLISTAPAEADGLRESMLGGLSSIMHVGAGAILSAGLLQLADFETVKRFVDAAMQGDPNTSVMSGGNAPTCVLVTPYSYKCRNMLLHMLMLGCGKCRVWWCGV